MTAVNTFHLRSTFAARCAERRTILTRAAEQEAHRQAARVRHDWPAVAQAERELRKLWRAFAQLGDR